MFDRICKPERRHIYRKLVSLKKIIFLLTTTTANNNKEERGVG